MLIFDVLEHRGYQTQCVLCVASSWTSLEPSRELRDPLALDHNLE